MPRKHIITIAGKPGSGKSTTANKVAELLGYTRYSSGDFMREIARGRKVTIDELNKIAEKDQKIDYEIDESLRRLADNDRLVIDSRLAFHWIPKSFKVFLDLSLDLAAARIFRDMDESRAASGEKAKTVNEISNRVKNRLASERKRFKKLYDIDPYNKEYFDLVIDTSESSPYSVALKIFDAYNAWLNVEA